MAIIDNGASASVFTGENEKYLYTNYAEITGDGIDNDGNGYIDDYHGIDITTSTPMYDPANNYIPLGNNR